MQQFQAIFLAVSRCFGVHWRGWTPPIAVSGYCLRDARRTTDMAEDTSASSVASSAPAEQPTSSAKLAIELHPSHISATAEGTVPAAHAPTLITTLGMVVMGVAGIAGADLTLQHA